MYDSILIRYAELALKGKNRHRFVNRLIQNIKTAMKTEKGKMLKIRNEQGRIFLELGGEKAENYYPLLKKVFGIYSFSPVRRCAKDFAEITRVALEEFASLGDGIASFKVEARRADKSFAPGSQEMKERLGGAVLSAYPGLKVKMKDPDAKVWVEVRFDACYIYTKVIKGAGGLPVGTGGKALVLLSGGIDSPVAAWLALKRGLKIEAIHFHSHPYTSEQAKEKVLDLARVVAGYGGEILVHIIPFTRIQEEIGKHCRENLWVTLMRRFMFRIAEEVAKERKALALVTGESVGQVASQTLESIYVTNSVVTLPVLRPLIAADKEEIIAMARNIDTFDISIRPFEDCCTVFLPKEPKTKPRLEDCLIEEQKLNLEELVDEAVREREIVNMTAMQEEADFFKISTE